MRTARGFTLLEMLVSLGMLSVLMILISSSLLSSRRVIQSTEAYGVRLDEIRAAQRFLRETLQSRVPLPLQDKLGSTLLFEGNSSKLRFVAPVPAGLGGQLKLNQIETITGDAEVSLRLTFYDRRTAAPWGNPQTLLSKLQSVRFEYQGRDEQLRTTGWLSTWPWPNRWPEAVRIEANTQGPIMWPRLTVRLRQLAEKPL